MMHPFAQWLMIAVICGISAAAVADTPPSAYAGQESRSIKALSAEEIATLRDGLGMGLAKAAVLNHYPGPAHVFELADELQLSADQRARTEATFHQMRERARGLGAALIAAERDLDQMFAATRATPDAVEQTLSRVADGQARLRAVHLNAHLAQRDILSATQLARYDQVRGYGAPVSDTQTLPATGHAH